jgi:hypothetical protein
MWSTPKRSAYDGAVQSTSENIVTRGYAERRCPWRGRLVVAVACLALALCFVGPIACSSDEDEDGSTTSTRAGGRTSGDVDGRVGSDIEAGDAVITVRALTATFQPAMPVRRLSEQTPVSPEAGESFYQAFVRVQNNAELPLRVDAEDFTLAVGDSVVGIEPTRSGPPARSLLLGTSLDLVLTFKAEAGYEPVLLYSPAWYDGTIRVTSAPTGPTTTD